MPAYPLPQTQLSVKTPLDGAGLAQVLKTTPFMKEQAVLAEQQAALQAAQQAQRWEAARLAELMLTLHDQEAAQLHAQQTAQASFQVIERCLPISSCYHSVQPPKLCPC